MNTSKSASPRLCVKAMGSTTGTRDVMKKKTAIAGRVCKRSSSEGRRMVRPVLRGGICEKRAGVRHVGKSGRSGLVDMVSKIGMPVKRENLGAKGSGGPSRAFFDGPPDLARRCRELPPLTSLRGHRPPPKSLFLVTPSLFPFFLFTFWFTFWNPLLGVRERKGKSINL